MQRMQTITEYSPPTPESVELRLRTNIAQSLTRCMEAVFKNGVDDVMETLMYSGVHSVIENKQYNLSNSELVCFRAIAYGVLDDVNNAWRHVLFEQVLAKNAMSFSSDELQYDDVFYALVDETYKHVCTHTWTNDHIRAFIVQHIEQCSRDRATIIFNDLLYWLIRSLKSEYVDDIVYNIRIQNAYSDNDTEDEDGVTQDL